MTDNFREDFLQLNANKDFICAEFASLFRDLLRGVAMQGDPGASIWQASKKMAFVVDLLSRTKDKVRFVEMFSCAVESARLDDVDDEVEEDLLHAARAGMALYLELSSTDNAAAGRITQRREKFMTSIQQVAKRRGV